MKSKHHFFLFITIVIGLVIMSSFKTTDAEMKRQGPESVTHVVLCWLTDSGNISQQEEIIRISKTFKQVPGVADVSAGCMIPSDRPIVDSTFDVGIIIKFTDKEAMAKYLIHPLHKKALRETLRPLVRKIVVYDFFSEE